jgi:hypothetical protein
MAVEAGEDRVWFWIGSHAEYDKLLAGRLTSVCTRRRRVDAARNRSGAAAAAETLT